jgi:hypothetical protein
MLLGALLQTLGQHGDEELVVFVGAEGFVSLLVERYWNP